ncbi:MAG: transposase, partial [Prevotella sp.]|nr:transposase [Prevotella sp.]
QEKDMVVGVDLGLNVPVSVATNKTSARRYIANRESFLQQRMVFQRRFKALQRLQLTRGGRGRYHKLAPLERLRESERNWVRTKNHLFSKEVITFAKQVMASTINMERLTGFGKAKTGEVKEDKKFMLRNWSYFELQNQIEYKAKMANIKVQYVTPAFTSQMCSECGQIGERNSTHFQCKNPECKNFGKDIHADYNGARNIAKSNDILKE